MTLKVAIIGCGQIAETQHAPAYIKSGRVEIKYAVDGIVERAEAFAKKFSIPYVTTSLDEVLEDPEIDAISVCTPNATHAPISIAALKAGKHVLCEKPAALSYEEVVQMKQAADENKKMLNIGVVNRYNTAVNKVKALIDAGELGELYHIVCSFRMHRAIPGLGGAFTTKSMSGGGVLIDWGIHYLDIIFYLLGEQTKVESVTGTAYTKLGHPIQDYTYNTMWAGPPKVDGTYDVDDYVTGFVRTNGPTINFNGAWAQNIGGRHTYIDFLGTKAGIKLHYGGEFTLYSAKDGVLYESSSSFEKEDMFLAEINSFIDSIQTGHKSRANIDYTMVTSEVMDAIYTSSAQRSELTL